VFDNLQGIQIVYICPQTKQDYFGDPGVDARIILRRIFRMWAVRAWNGSSWLRIGTGGWYL